MGAAGGHTPAAADAAGVAAAACAALGAACALGPDDGTAAPAGSAGADFGLARTVAVARAFVQPARPSFEFPAVFGAAGFAAAGAGAGCAAGFAAAGAGAGCATGIVGAVGFGAPISVVRRLAAASFVAATLVAAEERLAVLMSG